MSLPSTAVRGDIGVLATLGLQYPKAFLDVLANANKIIAPFDLDAYGVRDTFLRNYLDLIAFLLQGLPSDGTLTAVMAYMVEDFYRPGAVMDFPKGGSGAIIDAVSPSALRTHATASAGSESTPPPPPPSRRPANSRHSYACPLLSGIRSNAAWQPQRCMPSA